MFELDQGESHLGSRRAMVNLQATTATRNGRLDRLVVIIKHDEFSSALIKELVSER